MIVKMGFHWLLAMYLFMCQTAECVVFLALEFSVRQQGSRVVTPLQIVSQQSFIRVGLCEEVYKSNARSVQGKYIDLHPSLIYHERQLSPKRSD